MNEAPTVTVVEEAPRTSSTTVPSPPLGVRLTAPFRWAVRTALYPYYQVRGRRRARRARERRELVHDVMRLYRETLALEEEAQARRQIKLAPQNFKGRETKCAMEDGGCGLRVMFGPLRMQRVGDREVWKLVCPSCRKQRVVLSLTPELKRLQADALDEFRRKGQLEEAYRTYEDAVLAYNRRLHEIRVRAAKEGAGAPPEIDGAAEPPESDEQQAPGPEGA